MPDWRVTLADIRLEPEDLEAVRAALESGWLTQGPRTQSFERAFAAYAGTEHALAVSSGTAALHIACVAAGLGPGDEVICPSLTFVASANAPAYTGAEVVLADVRSPLEPVLCAERVAELITPRTRAVMLVHYAGYPAIDTELERLCDEHGLMVIEDAAHAAGTRVEGLHAGAWGDFGCFSFFSNKNLAIGEGGMLVTSDHDLHERAKPLRSHGMSTLTWDRHRGHASGYDVTARGFNYRLDEPRSALGESRLRRLDADNDRRRQLVALYREALADVEGVEVPFGGRPLEGSSHHILPVLVEAGGRDARRESMAGAGIQTSLHYPPVHTFSVYAEARRGDLAATEEYAARTITLPLHPLMEAGDVQAVVEALTG
ncbi:MAG: DegT/DnrJ/EryC1/StrS family aminotransferase [Thermoleophilaceae bacterium]|nr:DegT/DnrJ/EryC1/StrS family aminotransferase [Thermoleophilaceae bacterium]